MNSPKIKPVFIINQVVTGVAGDFPCAYQAIRELPVDFLYVSFMPITNASGNPGNDYINFRLYKGRVAQQSQLLRNGTYTKPDDTDLIAVGRLGYNVQIPFGDIGDFLIEFSCPTGGSVPLVYAFTLEGFNV